MNKYLLPSLLLLSSFFTSSTPASEYAAGSENSFLEILSDSGIKGPAYQKIVDDLVKLQMQFPNSSEIFRYGQTLKGRPLVGIKVYNKSVVAPKNAKTILIAGSIHGNEYLNIEDRLPSWVLKDAFNQPFFSTFFNNGGAFIFIPILNPDGYEARERENDHGVDLNRDFSIKTAGYKAFNEPETTSLSVWLEKELTNRKLSLTMDYHCCIGALLRPWSYSEGGDLPASDESRFLNLQKVFHRTFSTQYKVGRTPIVLGYSALGTSKDYYYEKYGALSFTFEGVYAKENQNLELHKKMWTTFVEQINLGNVQKR